MPEIQKNIKIYFWLERSYILIVSFRKFSVQLKIRRFSQMGLRHFSQLLSDNLVVERIYRICPQSFTSSRILVTKDVKILRVLKIIFYLMLSTTVS